MAQTQSVPFWLFLALFFWISIGKDARSSALHLQPPGFPCRFRFAQSRLFSSACYKTGKKVKCIQQRRWQLQIAKNKIKIHRKTRLLLPRSVYTYSVTINNNVFRKYSGCYNLALSPLLSRNVGNGKIEWLNTRFRYTKM